MKVGSLRWLEASASRRWSSIKLSDVWLLVLRCLILILLAVALAIPVWEKAPSAQAARKAVFISPELLHSRALANIKPTVNALLQRGYTLHRYTPGFAAIPAEEWETLSSTLVDSVQGNGDHWALLPALAQRYPLAQDSVWLFTSDQQRHFAGTPAPLQENIQWIPVALEQTNNWLQAAYATFPDSLLLITGHSTRQGTTYQQTRIAASVPAITLAGEQVKLTAQQGKLVAQWDDNTAQQVPLNSQPLRIGIAHDEAQLKEVRYLQAALQAISRYTGIPLETRVIPADAAPDSSANWLFWLASEEVPTSWLEQIQEQGTNLWVQPAAEPEASTAYLTNHGEKIRLLQLAPSNAIQTATAVWHTSAGEPLLMVRLTGKGLVYTFRSGFSPAWSQLGQSAQLPELLLPLLLPGKVSSIYDARALEEAQLKPGIQAAKTKETLEEQQIQLLPWLVLAAFLLFLAERLITQKRATT